MLNFILAILFVFCLILNYLSFQSTKSAMKIAQEMGIGYNLGNLFDCYNTSKEIINPDDQITLCGNEIPSKNMIKNIKKYGFKTIRFPITWLHFIDENGNINPIWMSRVKEVVHWIIDSNLYCIINIQNDGLKGNWLREGLIMKNKFINLWKQIANEFKNYDEHLIFESMKDIDLLEEEGEDYNLYLKMFFEFQQIFVDTIRNSEGYNKNRLLIIPGIKMNIEDTCSSKFNMPKDPSNKLAISILFYYPYSFVMAEDGKPYTYFLNNESLTGIPSTQWGSDSDYIELISNFEQMKNHFVNNKIPVVLTECTVLTEQKKEISSIREYLYNVFSLSLDYNAIIPCLWDTSKKTAGVNNFYDRENNKWYDENIKNNFLKISKRKNIKPINYYYISNIQTITTPGSDGNFLFKIDKKTVLKISFNAQIPNYFISNLHLVIISYGKNSEWIFIEIGEKDVKRQNDGTFSFNMDVSNKDCNGMIYLLNDSINEVIINYLTIEFKENFLSFNYTGFKSDISEFIS